MRPQSSILVVSTLVSACIAVWPQPEEMQTGSQVLWLDPAVTASLRCEEDGHLHESSYPLHNLDLKNLLNEALLVTQEIMNRFQSPSENSSNNGQDSLTEDSILKEAVRDTIKSIGKSRFVPWKLHKRGTAFEPDSTAPRHYISTLQIQQRTCPSHKALHPASFFASDESYEIDIGRDGAAFIRSNSSIGTIRGLETLQQLFFAHSSSKGVYTPFIPVNIVDKPKWGHRGLSIDIARNPFKPQDLFRTIDAMASAKLSRLHVHATDSQSWPLEIPSFPALAPKGAYHPDLVWSIGSLREIQIYGASKGISVFIEIDVPGHTAAIAHAYPDLIAAFNELDWSTFAAEPLSGQLKLNSDSVDKFVTTLLDDLLPRTKPYTSLYHVGGDEVNLPAYILDETVQSGDVKVLQPLLQAFIDKIVDISVRHGLQPIVWEEMLLDWNLTLPSSKNGASSTETLVQVWRNSERIEEVLKKGHRAIFGDYHFWYLDCKWILTFYRLHRGLPRYHCRRIWQFSRPISFREIASRRTVQHVRRVLQQVKEAIPRLLPALPQLASDVHIQSDSEYQCRPPRWDRGR